MELDRTKTGEANRLENSIKSEISLLRGDLGNLLERVEITEKKTDEQAQELCNLKEQTKIILQNQKKILYRIEDQENRDRRQNIRIRSVPEKKRRPEEYHIYIIRPPPRWRNRRIPQN